MLSITTYCNYMLNKNDGKLHHIRTVNCIAFYTKCEFSHFTSIYEMVNCPRFCLC